MSGANEHLIYRDGTAGSTPISVQSKFLTVKRTLHIEPSRMQQPLRIGFAYDTDDGNTPLLVREVDPTLISVLQEAFIDVEYHRRFEHILGVYNDGDLGFFRQYYKPHANEIESLVNEAAQLENDDSLWVVQLIGAYEYDFGSDHDSEASWIIGMQYDNGLAAFFNETFQDVMKFSSTEEPQTSSDIFNNVYRPVAKDDLRNINEERKILTSHELFHALVGGHSKPWVQRFGLMSALTLLNDAAANEFRANGINERNSTPNKTSWEGVSVMDDAYKGLTNMRRSE